MLSATSTSTVRRLAGYSKSSPSLYTKVSARSLSTPAKSRFDHTKDELAEGSKKVDMHKTFKRNNFVPASQGDVKPAIAQAMPANPSEVAVFSGMPSEHAARTVIIAPRPNKTMQNGEGYLHQWQITWQHTGKWDNPLMGWSSSADPLGTLKLTFDSEEAAIAYADKMGFKYELRAPVTDTNPNADGANPGSKTYNHNFLTKRISVELARDGQSSTQFRHEGENKSHWFMPLTYDGSAEVEQHGPRNQAK